ncbi:hypothetical protein HBI56_228540 [Parastagonospora nodorum]|uniref:C2H2-type domain-containing protein n=2 Tax=Phaeosphaeria nodorum (strain SN15 / ATCC MYA-4574 / FGSC 10173) TaxID=321614 RepID=A0A7U2IAK1_PHANO|nr:hypothetical protein SNOG_11658 [Parastagonospora nodorum SN15]KAH3908264.1 hypothetical protein HBH56_180450 [Parastagonospora nodorum]EAT80702.1 hypothetical protein SNOG_11658 [Parastagonospora nodorum SN15]KAH3931876.1 hypothetical protein HBH54_089380 [Parastagonospora nodorum]KAH3972848.1 hypothetical protein HBH51_103470 [Parastagonospora nodorum]KAH3996054.1 hypothetical protein HBI10_159620 [Parastagonospora nodorum]
MSYPPNNPEVASRAPQHGIRIANSSIAVTEPSAKHTLSTGTSASALTVNCATSGCTNTVIVVLFGQHHDRIHVKVDCKECHLPVFVVEEKEQERVDEGWAETADEVEEWEQAQEGDGFRGW